jgi:hypothetical protein
MNTRLAATLMIAALITPVAGHAADGKPDTESTRQNVGDGVTTTRIRVEYAKDKPVKITRHTTGVSSVKNDSKAQAKQ